VSVPASSVSDLRGRGIVITRPAGQSGTLARLVERHGGCPILFPVISILPVDDPTRVNRIIDALETFDFAIFISPNAVERGMAAIRARRSLPSSVQMVAIGGASARALRERGVSSVVAPRARSDSEALLELPELTEVHGKRIAIFRGEGGRAFLGDTLTGRGASVEYAECYRRAKPDVNVDELVASWSATAVAGVVATSSEGLRNLADMLGEAGRERLSRTTLFVPHPRIAATASELGLTSVVVTAPGDDGIVERIVRHFSAAG
jgi:uroporphyrinogen-III synthase